MGKKVTVIGGGNMGGALIEGFLKSGRVAAQDIVVADLSESTRQRFGEKGLAVSAKNREAVTDADIVILAVKPWYIDEVAHEIHASLPKGAVVVSVAAGVPLSTLESHFGADIPLFRAIPNIAAADLASMTFLSCASHHESDAVDIQALFDTVGVSALVPESQLDAAMVVASCGTAYALRYLRAAMEAGIQMGLTAQLSRTAVAQTLKGAAELLLNSDLHPEEAVDQVTTPGGVTIVGLNAMEKSGFTGAVLEGHLAAYDHVKAK